MNAQKRQQISTDTRHAPRQPAYGKRLRSPVQKANSRTRFYCESLWVRSAQSQLEFLTSGQVIDAETKSVIEFAIRWAPFGGASSGDLLVTFGVNRRRFVKLLQEGLATRRADNSEQRWLKQRLSDALISAWCLDIDPIPSSGTPRC